MWLQSHVAMLINKERHFEEKYRLDHYFRKNKQSIYAGGTEGIVMDAVVGICSEYSNL